MGNRNTAEEKYQAQTCCGECSIQRLTLSFLDLQFFSQVDDKWRKLSFPSLFVSPEDQSLKKIFPPQELSKESSCDLLLKGCYRQKSRVLNLSLMSEKGINVAYSSINLPEEEEKGPNRQQEACELLEICSGEKIGRLIFAIDQEKIEIQDYLFRVQSAFLRMQKDYSRPFIVEIDTGIDKLVFEPEPLKTLSQEFIFNPWKKTLCGRVQLSSNQKRMITVKFIKKSDKKHKILGMTEFLFEPIENKISSDLVLRKRQVEGQEKIIGMLNLGIMPGNIPEAMLPPSSLCKYAKRKNSSPTKPRQSKTFNPDLIKEFRKRSLHISHLQ